MWERRIIAGKAQLHNVELWAMLELGLNKADFCYLATYMIHTGKSYSVKLEGRYDDTVQRRNWVVLVAGLKPIELDRTDSCAVLMGIVPFWLIFRLLLYNL